LVCFIVLGDIKKNPSGPTKRIGIPRPGEFRVTVGGALDIFDFDRSSALHKLINQPTSVLNYSVVGSRFTLDLLFITLIAVVTVPVYHKRHHDHRRWIFFSFILFPFSSPSALLPSLRL
jgi:UDP-N-acetylglucosamine transferase subunit ALG13